MNTLSNVDPQIVPKYRIGAIAKMSGVAIATLRVWQRRYGVVQPQKSSGGQRLFDDDDLTKLKCIKELIDLGFAIGTLAHLKLDELKSLKEKTLINRGFSLPAEMDSGPLRILVVGAGLQDRLTGLNHVNDVNFPKIKVEQVYADLNEALELHSITKPSQGAGLLACVVKLNTLQLQNLKPIQSLQEQMEGAAFGVIYNYANPEVVASLQGMKIELLPNPFETTDLIEFIQKLNSTALRSHEGEALPPHVRRFTAQDLEFIARFGSSVGCECPRHIAQIVEQLGSFEQYSRECLSLNPKDQQIHKMLARVASHTLSMFEHALQDVMTHEKIELPVNSERI